ncbi:MAG: hypothetical protein AAF532_15255 [Planctomycetota bacterium]
MHDVLRIFPGEAEYGEADARPESPSLPEAVETILQVIGGDSPEQRVTVVRVEEGGLARVELRQQSFASGIGWYTQSSVELAESQLHALWPTLRMAAPKSQGVVRPATPTVAGLGIVG